MVEVITNNEEKWKEREKMLSVLTFGEMGDSGERILYAAD